ncbi:uncharacterized protein LOC122306400 [Carya illinoinensis]|uniref:uncharacterized protein LOC122306400 n=1 Tax=Carya illinoinensis TaxID=32201 RepID=UPI001C71D57A|nr:uncharacterized protein LOC122306400 [Carya illinoinensis]
MVEKIRAVAYHLELLIEFHEIHNVFHVSSLKKSFGNQTLAVVDPNSIPLQFRLTYEEKPLQIIDWKEEELQNCRIPLVKVLWQNHNVQEATRKKEVDMQAKNPSCLEPNLVLFCFGLGSANVL